MPVSGPAPIRVFGEAGRNRITCRPILLVRVGPSVMEVGLDGAWVPGRTGWRSWQERVAEPGCPFSPPLLQCRQRVAPTVRNTDFAWDRHKESPVPIVGSRPDLPSGAMPDPRLRASQCPASPMEQKIAPRPLPTMRCLILDAIMLHPLVGKQSMFAAHVSVSRLAEQMNVSRKRPSRAVMSRAPQRPVTVPAPCHEAVQEGRRWSRRASTLARTSPPQVATRLLHLRVAVGSGSLSFKRLLTMG